MVQRFPRGQLVSRWQHKEKKNVAQLYIIPRQMSYYVHLIPYITYSVCLHKPLTFFYEDSMSFNWQQDVFQPTHADYFVYWRSGSYCLTKTDNRLYMP